MPVSLISYLKVLQSPQEGSVGEPTIDSDEFVISDCLQFKSLSCHFLSPRKDLISEPELAKAHQTGVTQAGSATA